MAAPRFGYMTIDMENLRKARELALLAGYVVDLLPPDAPVPAPGAYDGLLSDFAINAPHKHAHQTYLEKLVRTAKQFPIAVFDHTLSPTESGALRAAGIKSYPTVREKAFTALLAHPLATKPTVPAQAGDDGPDAGAVPAAV